MSQFVPLAAFVMGLAVGAAVVWWLLRSRVESARQCAKAEGEAERATLAERVQSREQALEEAKANLAQRDREYEATRSRTAELERKLVQYHQLLETERKQAQEKLGLLEEARVKLTDAFKGLAAEALKSNSTSFLELAKTSLEKYQETAKGDLDKRTQAIDELVKPMRESLEKFDGKVQEIEKARVAAYTGLVEHVKSLSDATDKLGRALRTPNVRGRWGEIQLKRVVEIAGMTDHCDFYEQPSIDGDEGKLRPDLMIRLPGAKTIVVDSKAPLSAYLEAVEAQDDETRRSKLIEHSRQVRSHAQLLGQKRYFDQFDSTPEFVVLFLPGEAFFSAALMHDAELIEFGVTHNVILATPTTLIALLRAVAYGWRQEKIAENAKEISKLGQTLHKRCSILRNHFADVGKYLGKAIESFNSAAGSLENRVLVSARKFSDLGAASKEEEIEAVSALDVAPRRIQITDDLDSALLHDAQ